MPTIARLGPFKIQIFADDHFPPHFHIVCADFEALVALSDLSILKGFLLTFVVVEFPCFILVVKYLVRMSVV